MKKLAIIVVIVLILYCSAYGVARWRKCIVMQTRELKEEGVLVRQTGPGFDVRDDWKGRLKNKVNPALYVFFRPLEFIEDSARGSRKPLPSAKS